MTLLINEPSKKDGLYKDIILGDGRDIYFYLNAIEEPIIIIEPTNYKVLFANDCARSKIPNLEKGPCWQAFGYSGPCSVPHACYQAKVLQAQAKDGVWREHRVSKIDLGNKKVIVEIFRDISEEIEIELERKRKSNLVSMASHELRTPLNIILSTIQLLEKYDDNWTSPNTFKHTQRIKKAAKRINTLLEDILLLEKTKAKQVRFNPQPIDIVNLSKSVIDGLESCDKISHEIIFKSNKAFFTARVDEFLITTILNNLLSNASKYSREDKEVRIDLDIGKTNMAFTIRDEGIGIPLEEQKHLFETFYRTSNVGRVKGMGLGLTIVRDFVHIHRGSLEFTSAEGEGTTFVVKIPIE